MRRATLLAALLAWLAGPAAAQPACPVPDTLRPEEVALPAAKAQLAAAGRLQIVALGAGSTEGHAAGNPELTYPARLAARLGAALGVPVSVLNRGALRQTAREMLERLDRDVLAGRPALVVWEAGTMDAVRGTNLEEFAQTVEDGIERLRAARIDVILMDMQFAPSTASIIDFTPYSEALRRLAEADGVPMIRRFDLMRSWSEDGVFDYDETDPEARERTARRVYDCVAAFIGETIAPAVR
jgi:lysophospholipase L1-like esterase